MLAMIFSRVLLPEPLRPTMPKNSPLWTSKDTSRSAWSSRVEIFRSGWVTRSLSVSIRWSGTMKVLLSPRASSTTGPALAPVRVDRAAADGREAPSSVVSEAVMGVQVGRGSRAF